MPFWREALTLTHGPFDGVAGPKGPALRCQETAHWSPQPRLDAIYNAMVLGLRDYARKNRFPGVVLGMSGGIDSALTAAVAVDALGAAHVRGGRLPSRFTSKASLDDAGESAGMLGWRRHQGPIGSPAPAPGSTLAPPSEGPARDG